MNMEEITSFVFKFHEAPIKKRSLTAETPIGIVPFMIGEMFLNIKDFQRYNFETTINVPDCDMLGSRGFVSAYLAQSLEFDIFTYRPKNEELFDMIREHAYPDLDSLVETIIDIANTTHITLPIPRTATNSNTTQDKDSKSSKLSDKSVPLSEVFTKAVCNIIGEMIFCENRSVSQIYFELMKYLVSDDSPINENKLKDIKRTSLFYKYVLDTWKNCNHQDWLFRRYLINKQYIVENKFASMVDAKRITELLDRSATLESLKYYRKQSKLSKDKGDHDKADEKLDSKNDEKTEKESQSVDAGDDIVEELEGLQTFLDQFCDVCDNSYMMTDTKFTSKNSYTFWLPNKMESKYNTVGCNIFLFGVHNSSKRVIIVMFKQVTQENIT